MQDIFINLDSKVLDEQITEYADYVYADNKQKFLQENAIQTHLGFMASELYEIGGHTPCLVNFVEAFYQEYDITLFLTHKNETIVRTAIPTMQKLAEKIKIKGIDCFDQQIDPEPYIIDLYNQIITSKVKTIVLYVHSYDLVAAAVCHLIQKYTKIKIVFVNQGDHARCIGANSADIIFDGRPSGYKTTNEIRGYNNNIIMNILSKKQDTTTYYSQQEKDDFKKENDLTKEFIVLTGANFSKLFDNENESQFFNFVKDLLVKEKNIQYVIVTTLRAMFAQYRGLINRIFAGNEEAFSRLIFLSSRHDFDLMFQSCDVFVDSFPQGSALTHIDCMRNKLCTIVKMNLEKPIKSFEYYVPQDYPYKFATVDEIITTISNLYENRHKKNLVIDDMYNYFLERYEFDVVKKTYREIIEIKKEDVPAYLENWKQKHPIK